MEHAWSSAQLLREALHSGAFGIKTKVEHGRASISKSSAAVHFGDFFQWLRDWKNECRSEQRSFNLRPINEQKLVTSSTKN